MSTRSHRAGRRGGAVAAGVALAALSLVACGSGSSGGGSAQGDTVTYWTQQTTPPRLKLQQQTAAAFEKKTGIKVNVVPLAAADANQSLVTGAASGKVPDVIMSSATQVAQWQSQHLLDNASMNAVVDSLGRSTFSKRALDSVTADNNLGAVPSDGYGDFLYYRKDLFAAAGLSAPKTIEDVATAAEKLTTSGRTGIALGTVPGNPFTTETMEGVLQAGGCQLAQQGKVTLDSQQCVDALGVYQRLAKAAGPAQLDVDSARAKYLAGKSAMLIFSSYLLDELAGLDTLNPPTCPQCAGNKAFLAQHTGLVPALSGKDNPTPTGYGVTLNYSIPNGAHTGAAKQWISYLLSDGYLSSLQTAPEGRIPMRSGTTAQADLYRSGWSKLVIGNDPKQPKTLNGVYGQATATQITTAADQFQAWGYGTSDAALAGTVLAQNTLSQNVGPLFTGGSPQAVAAQLQKAVEAVQRTLK